MLPTTHTSGDRHVFCPYNKAHVILAKSMNAHLIRCRQNNKDSPMTVCRFDKTHVIPRPEKAHHESQCPSQYLLDRERQKIAGDQGVRGDVQGPPIIADHNTAIDVEDWSACPPVSTPALFNKKENKENFIGPYMPSGLAWDQYNSGGQGNERLANRRDQSLPHTSSIAANVAPSFAKTKVFPSKVFEYTSGYGRGRGKQDSSIKSSTRLSSPPPHLTPTATTAAVPVKGQFDNKAPDSDVTPKQVQNVNVNTSQNISHGSSSVKSELPRLQFLQEREQQLNQMKLLHKEQLEKLGQEQQLQIIQLQKAFAVQQQQLLVRQESQMKQLLEHFQLYEQIMSKSFSPSKSSTAVISPPGFVQLGVSASNVSASGTDAFGKTSAAALQKEIKSPPQGEESWHEEASAGTGLNLFPGLDTGYGQMSDLNSMSKWLNQLEVKDTFMAGVKGSADESLPESEALKSKRKCQKKLRQIAVLEQKVSLGHKLSQQEEEKLNQKANIIAELAAIDC